MSVLAIFTWNGDSDELISAYDRELEHGLPRDQERRRRHVCARDDGTMVIVDVWDSEDDLQRMVSDPEFQANLERSGGRAPDSMAIYPVHATIP